MIKRSGRGLWAVACVMLSACSGAGVADESVGTSQEAVGIPAKGSASTLDVASWNLEWFGDASNGPSNEPLQLANARDVVAGADMDIWGFEEIVGSSQWNSLKSLSGYAGVLSSDASVVSGSTYYGASEQKVGLIYKTSLFIIMKL